MTAGRGAVDVVVVGGGIVGVCTALQLQRTGRRVMVVERDVPGDAASGHNGGMFSGDCIPVGVPGVILSLPRLLRDPESPLIIRMRYVPRLVPWLIRFALASRPSRVEAISIALASLTTAGLDAFRPLVEGTAAESVLRNRGCLYGSRRRGAFDPDSYSFRLRSRRGIAYEILDASGVARMSPAVAGRFESGVYFPNAFYTTDPRAFTQTLLDSFTEKGGLFERAEVTGLETNSHRVQTVRTSGGAVTTGAVVIAAGPWSRTLARRLGTDVPLDVERGYGADLPAPGLRLDVPVMLDDFHFIMSPHRTGLRVAGIDELASVSAPPDLRVAHRLLASARKVFPELRTEGANLWMRQRPSMPDSLPVIGRAPRYENAYFAFGHGHKGLGTGAITGKLVQELMDGEATTVDTRPFSPTRFSIWPRPS